MNRTEATGDDDRYQAEYAAAMTATVAALTAAVRLEHPRHGVTDFAGFLAEALAEVAANVGSAGRLIAGRSGSWEADLVNNLVCGTVGHDNEYLHHHRTAPVVVPVNVVRLMEESTWDTPATNPQVVYWRELDAVYLRHEALADDEYDQDAEDADSQAVTDRWSAGYAAYAEAFTAAVTAEAARIEGLNVPVQVEAITDPGADYGDGPDHPDAWTDPLTFRLFDAARRAVPLPETDTTTLPAAQESPRT